MLNRKFRIADAAVAVLAVLIVVNFAACSGTAGPTDPGTVVTGGPEPIVILNQVLSSVEPGGQRVINFSLANTSTLEITVRWDAPDNSVFAFLTRAGCPDVRDFVADCQERRSSERGGRGSREGVIDHPGASGAYRLVVENEGPGVATIHVTATVVYTVATPVQPTPYPTSHPPH